MIQQRRNYSLLATLMAAILLDSGCAGSGAAEQHLPGYVPAEVQLSSEIPAVSESRIDVHEDIRIIYREHETGAGWASSTDSSQADLAVIVLDQPVQGGVEPVRLAGKPVQLKERVVLVGFGTAPLALETGEPLRRYGENEVVSIKEDGSTFHIGTPLEVSPGYSGESPALVRRRGSYAESGDSGGPCLRERKGVLELVGIARSTHGPPMVLSVYTSTYKYLSWLRGKLQAVKSGELD